MDHHTKGSGEHTVSSQPPRTIFCYSTLVYYTGQEPAPSERVVHCVTPKNCVSRYRSVVIFVNVIGTA